MNTSKKIKADPKKSMIIPIKQENYFKKNSDPETLEALYKQSDLPSAYFFAKQNLDRNSKDPKFLKLSGVICHDMQKLDEAVEFFRIAAEFDVTSEARTNLAVTLLKSRKHKEALIEILKTKKFSYLNTLGKTTLVFLLLVNEQYDEAEKAVLGFQKIEPENPSWSESLARISEIRGDEEMFLRYMYEAITKTRDAKTAAFYYKKIGIYFSQKDKKEKSIENYKIALQKNPSDKAIYRLIALIDSSALSGQDLMEIMNDLDDIHDVDEKSQAYYTLADIADRHKEYALSGSLYDIAASLKRKDIEAKGTFDPERELGLAKSIISIFGNYDFRRERSEHVAKDRMIFVVGMPRSGTTLTESILANHSEVAALGELHYLRKFSGNERFNINKISEHSDIVGYSKSIFEKYMNTITSEREENILVDKMPGNANIIGIALAASRDTRVVNLVRDPMAVAWSIYSKFFPAFGMGFSFDKQWILNHYRMYLTMMDFWHQLFPGQIFDMYYERLTENQRDSTTKLLEYCGLGFQEACINFHENDRTIKTASSQQVKKKMYQGSSEKWKRYGDYLLSIRDELLQAQNDSLEKRVKFHQRLEIKYACN